MLLETALEALALDLGRTKYHTIKDRKVEAGEAANHKPYAKLIRGCLPMVSLGIQEWLGSQKELPTKHHTAYDALSSLDPDLIAYIGLWESTNAAIKRLTLRATAVRIGRLIEQELLASDLKARDPKKFGRLVERAHREHGSRRFKLKAITSGFKDVRWKTWVPTLCLRMGEPVLNAVLVHSGLFTSYTEEGATTEHLCVSEDVFKLLGEMEEAEQWLLPSYMPMVERPKPWRSVSGGCYKDQKVARTVHLVRGGDHVQTEMAKAGISDGSMAPFLEAVNAIQGTAFRVNPWTLDLVKWAWEEGTLIPKFPRRHLLPKVDFPLDYETMTPHEKKGWRIRARRITKKNREVTGHQLMMTQDLMVADKMVEAGRFWLPVNVDFRGRIYPLPYFNQQRSDHVRGLIEFADGLPLGPCGAYWLAVHLANCGDFGKISKRSLDERVQWVADNVEMIRSIAKEPKVDLRWTKADAPFAFAAACREWVGYLEEGPDFVSYIPVGLDGSNSGLQHYSAALRAEKDGTLVNLVPCELPGDVYRAVAEVAARVVAEDTEDPSAALWRAYGVDRKVVKRNVMTFAYSSEQYGFSEQLREDLMEPLAVEVLEGKRDAHPFGEDDGFKAANYLAKHVWVAVNQVVAEAAKGMKFFQAVTALLAAENKPLIWYTPLGLPVVHAYREWVVKQIEIFLYNRSIPVTEAASKDKIEGDKVLHRIACNMKVRPKETLVASKQRSACAPNIIHSMDATHLLMTVLAARKEEINDFCLIHDSFATHAGNTDRFGEIIREAFVDLYANFDIFQVIYDRAWEVLSEKAREKLPSPPTKGTLDLQGITKSLYAFA